MNLVLFLTRYGDCVIIYTDTADHIPTYTITETNLYVLVVTLSTQDKGTL